MAEGFYSIGYRIAVYLISVLELSAPVSYFHLFRPTRQWVNSRQGELLEHKVNTIFWGRILVRNNMYA